MFPSERCFVVAQPNDLADAAVALSRTGRYLIVENPNTVDGLWRWTRAWKMSSAAIWIFTMQTVSVQHLTVSQVSSLSSQSLRRIRRRVVRIGNTQHLVLLGPWQVALSHEMPLYLWDGHHTAPLSTWDEIRQALASGVLIPRDRSGDVAEVLS